MADVAKFFGSLFGTAAGAAASPASAVVDGASKIIGMFKLSPELKAQLQAQLVAENVDLEKAALGAELASVQGQLDINLQEAKSTSTWVAGWRPAIGWTCGVALFYSFVLQPFLQFTLAAFHVTLNAPIPQIDIGALVSGLLVPLLGLGTMRTVEKINAAQGADRLN